MISWTKLFDQLPGGRATVQGHTLTITKTDKKDSGTYICTATNAMGTSHSMTSLIVVTGDFDIFDYDILSCSNNVI